MTYYKWVQHHLQPVSEVKGLGGKQKELRSLFSSNTKDMAFVF